jgi:phosphate transport system substrate-binding protein
MKKILAGIVTAALVFSSVPGSASILSAAQKAVAAPTSSVASDYYASAQKVTLKTGTSGATIYYTTNSKTPTTASSKYASALTISKTTTLKAIAVKSGRTNSSVSTFTYNFGKLTENITADGSTALQPLLSIASTPFKKKYKGIFTGTISIQGGGSGTGLTDVNSGTVKIGDSDVTPEQLSSSSKGLVDHKVCVVAAGIAVSSNVAKYISNISTSDLKKIFSGTATNWKQISGWKGGSLPIQVYYRKTNSGTRCLFEAYGSGVSLTDTKLAAFQNFTLKASSGDVESALNNQASTAGAISYDTLPYCKKLSLLKFNGVAATYSNVYTGKYKIWGYEHMYTKGTPSATTQTFINFVSSKAFAATVLANGYGLTSLMKVSR